MAGWKQIGLQSLCMHVGRLTLFPWYLIGILFLQEAVAGVAYDSVTVATSSTSIYIGKVTLSVAPLTLKDGIFSGDYAAKVFPYWFMSERGTFRMKVSEEDLARVAKGEEVEFTGDAQNSNKETRKITGRATPENASEGRIKVRIFVTEKIQLIFNTTYVFGRQQTVQSVSVRGLKSVSGISASSSTFSQMITVSTPPVR